MSKSSLSKLDRFSGVVTWFGSLTKTREGRKGFCFSFFSQSHSEAEVRATVDLASIIRLCKKGLSDQMSLHNIFLLHIHQAVV